LPAEPGGVLLHDLLPPPSPSRPADGSGGVGGPPRPLPVLAPARSERVLSVGTGDGLPRDDRDGTGDGGMPSTLLPCLCNVLPGLGERDPPAPPSTDGRKLAVPSHRLRVLALLLLRRPAELLRSESALMGIPGSYVPRQLSGNAGAGSLGGGGTATGGSVRSAIGSRQIGHVSHMMAHVMQNP
jgi:hypothetical protein